MTVARFLRPDNVYELERFLKGVVKIVPTFCQRTPFSEVCKYERRGGAMEMYVVSGLGSRVKKLCEQAWELSPAVSKQLWLHGQWMMCRERMEHVLAGLQSLGLETKDWQQQLFGLPAFQIATAIGEHPENAGVFAELQALMAADDADEDDED